MSTAGIVGLGDMGSGLARNLVRNGFRTVGYDLSDRRMMEFRALGGDPAADVANVARCSDAVFVMVMTGDQARSVILGEDGLVVNMRTGGTIILTATITPADAREIADRMAETSVRLVDSPVSGGFPGAQNGTLTLMAAGKSRHIDDVRPFLEAVSTRIHVVGNNPGDGQTVKACLQSLIGAIFAATFETSVLAAKAGVSGEAFHEVVASSGAGCGVASTALENIIDRRFEGTGSHIDTMHKDLTIALDMAAEQGVPVHMASTAMQIFRAGRTKHPRGDNWVCTRVLEDIVGAELHR